MTNEEATEYWEGLRKTFSSQLEQEENHFGRMHLQTTIDAIAMAISSLRQQETVTNRNGLNEPLTNAQKIRSMTDEELAEFLWDFNLADVSTVKMGEFGPHMFRYRLKEWLQQPSGEEEA